MSEREDAIRLANAVLDKPHIDPDGDVCMLARQFLREIERGDKAREVCGFFASVIKSGERWSTTCEEDYAKARISA